MFFATRRYAVAQLIEALRYKPEETVAPQKKNSELSPTTMIYLS
jgi:hypothetical protein